MHDEKDYKEQVANLRAQVEELESDLEMTIIALHKIEHKLKVLRDVAEWGFTPGANLGGFHNQGSFRNILMAMQGDVLALTKGYIVQVEGEELPF